MDGMKQRARDGGAAMSRDGRYEAKSQGWRCCDVQGWMVYSKEKNLIL